VGSVANKKKRISSTSTGSNLLQTASDMNTSTSSMCVCSLQSDANYWVRHEHFNFINISAASNRLQSGSVMNKRWNNLSNTPPDWPCPQRVEEWVGHEQKTTGSHQHARPTRHPKELKTGSVTNGKTTGSHQHARPTRHPKELKTGFWSWTKTEESHQHTRPSIRKSWKVGRSWTKSQSHQLPSPMPPIPSVPPPPPPKKPKKKKEKQNRGGL
jgi:hypothetical protein